MKKSLIAIVSALTLSLLSISTTASYANDIDPELVTKPVTIKNADFSLPDLRSSARGNYRPGYDIGGWKVLPAERRFDYWGSVDIYGSGLTGLPCKGQAFSPNGGVGAISQVLTDTVPGAKVTVNFKASTDTWNGTMRDMVQAFHMQIGKNPETRQTYVLGTQPYEYTKNPVNPSNPSFNDPPTWKDYSFTFTANGNDELRIMAGNYGDAGPLIADITATQEYQSLG